MIKAKMKILKEYAETLVDEFKDRWNWFGVISLMVFLWYNKAGLDKLLLFFILGWFFISLGSFASKKCYAYFKKGEEEDARDKDS